MPTLDFEFTARCTHASCIYCDSRPEVGQRHPNELNWRETERLLREGRRLGLKWLYACGLGEPLEDVRFQRIVETASDLGVKLSVFTNGILIDKELARWLHDHDVHLILKLDTFDESAFDTILGKKDAARKTYDALDFLLASGYGQSGRGNHTDMAFSIVPTRLNMGTIEDVLKFAKANNIFPSVGELEQAGRALEGTTYSDLSLSAEEIRSLREMVEALTWKGYKRPICPTILTGVHIDNIGNCVVDSETGFNCKWFLLRDPVVRVLGNVRQHELAALFQSTKEYRKKCFDANGKAIKYCESVDYVFGGCGGSPKEIVRIARDHIGADQGVSPRISASWP